MKGLRGFDERKIRALAEEVAGLYASDDDISKPNRSRAEFRPPRDDVRKRYDNSWDKDFDEVRNDKDLRPD